MSNRSTCSLRRFFAALCVAAALLYGTSRAGTSPVTTGSTTTFNFENQPISDPSSLTTLTLGPGGLLTLSATDPQAFGFQDLSALQIQGAQALGARSIQPDLYDQTAPFNVNFSQTVTSFSMDFADASDQTDQLGLKAFSGLNGSGTLIDGRSAILSSALDRFAVQTLTVSGQAIRSVQFVGGPPGMDTAFFDNFSVTTASAPPSAVPLPTAAAVFPIGAVIACWAGRKLCHVEGRGQP